MTEQQGRKQTIRQYLRVRYTDERAAWLLEHARQGKLAYMSCCCFIGIPSADHALRGTWSDDRSLGRDDEHYLNAIKSVGAELAQKAFRFLGTNDEGRRRILIPIVKAELRRRDRARQAQQIQEPVEVFA